MKRGQVCIDPQEMMGRWKKFWNLHVAEWMDGCGDWPKSWPLHGPTEAETRADYEGTGRWIVAWRNWAKKNNAVSALQWETRHWRGLSMQELPTRVVCGSPKELAAWIGETGPWHQATERFARLTMRYPALASVLRKYYSVLAQDSEIDQRRVESMLEWLIDHPASGLYPRQLPVSGLDTKWLNAGRKRQLKDWLRQIQKGPVLVEYGLQEKTEREALSKGDTPEDVSGASIDYDERNNDFYVISGLRTEPSFLCLRILDPELRSEVGGLSLLTTPIEEAARLKWSVGAVLVVENLTTGWALEDLPAAVAVVGRGYVVNVLADLPWMRSARVGYWGDIDTHGFSILNRFRMYFPQSQSLMMDMETLTTHQDLCVLEAKPHSASFLSGLRPSETEVYIHLKQNPGLRLEQERIAWNYACARLAAWAMTHSVSSSEDASQF